MGEENMIVTPLAPSDITHTVATVKIHEAHGSHEEREALNICYCTKMHVRWYVSI